MYKIMHREAKRERLDLFSIELQMAIDRERVHAFEMSKQITNENDRTFP